MVNYTLQLCNRRAAHCTRATAGAASLALLLLPCVRIARAQQAGSTVDITDLTVKKQAQDPNTSTAGEDELRRLDEQIRRLTARRAALQIARKARPDELPPGQRLDDQTALSAMPKLAAAPDPQQGKAAPPEKPRPQTPENGQPGRYQVNGQMTWILQNLFKFHSPYETDSGGFKGGSLLSRNETEMSQTYTLFLGARINRNVEVYIDPEMARGHGIGNSVGLAGYTDGEVIRNPALSQDPYLARYYAKWNIATGKGEEKVDAGQNQVSNTRPTHRLVVSAGKMGSNDIFDLNAYANNTRTQFMNWALINNAAWDYAADTRGYSLGVAVEWINPDFALRIGSFQMPTVANGADLAGDIARNRGDNLELEYHLPHGRLPPTIIRLLAYRNLAHMGNYDAAVALAPLTGTVPDIISVETPGNVKYGFGLNTEIPLGDDGDTGLFLRYGWGDGATESFAYTECDRSLSLGGQLSGKRWHRRLDRLGIAFAQNDLSGSHKNYLAAGGAGFQLGDGKLNYGPERIVEAYYRYQFNKSIAFTVDYQFINNPGYNQDRGPVNVLSGRLHLEF